MTGDEATDDTRFQVFFDVRAGAPTPLPRSDPGGGWGSLTAAIADDADGYVTIDATPGALAIPDGTQGRVSVQLSTPGTYEVTLGSGDYHLVFNLECNGCEIDLGFGAGGGPRLAGSAVGPYGVSPIINGANLSGLTHLEFSAKGGKPVEMRHATLRPGLALLARGSSLWLTRIGLTIENLPDLANVFPGEPAPTLLAGSAELVLAHSMVKLPEVQRLPRVRVVASYLPVAGMTANIEELVVAAGCRYSVPSDADVRHCVLHQHSTLRIAPYADVGEVKVAMDPRNEHLGIIDHPPIIEVPSRESRRVSSIGSVTGPARVQLDSSPVPKADKWRPGELWIRQRAEHVRFAVSGSRYTERYPPTVRFMPGAIGQSNAFEVQMDDRGDRQVAMRVGLHMAERSGLYEASGEVLLRLAQQATIDGAHDGGLLIAGLVPPEERPFDEPEPEDGFVQATTQEPPAVFSGARATDIKFDLASDDAPRLLQELRAADVFDAHPSVWSASGEPLGLPALDRSETPLREECWLTPWTRRRPMTGASRQHDLSLALLGEVTKERGGSGTVRSGVARAVLVRRQQRTRYWPEHALLLVGRPLGFGYLILRAAVAWVVVSLVVAGLALADSGFDPSFAGIVNLCDGVLNVATEPFGIIRGVRAQTWLESEVGTDRQYLATIARVAVAVPLASMFLAIARRSRSGPS